MENLMETTGVKGVILGFILGLCRDNGKENGNDYLGFRVGLGGLGGIGWVNPPPSNGYHKGLL